MILPRASAQGLSTRVAITGLIAAVIIITGADLCAMAATVTLSPPANIQNAVDVNRPGTVFALRPGIYREASVTSLKNGDSFIGEPGAIMDGAKQLSG